MKEPIVITITPAVFRPQLISWQGIVTQDGKQIAVTSRNSVGEVLDELKAQLIEIGTNLAFAGER